MAAETPSFVLPEMQDNPDGSWGPSTSQIPTQYKDIPYAPYSKSDKIGRFADWNEIEARGTTRDGGAAAGARQTRRYREGPAAYGAGGPSAFSYTHAEDDASFSLVDNKNVPAKRAGSAFNRGGGRGGPMRNQVGQRGQPAQRGGSQQRGGGGYAGGRGGNRDYIGRGGMRLGRRGWRDWEKPGRSRESSIPIGPTWNLLEEIDFSRLAKLRLDVDTSSTIGTYGKLHCYDRTFDRISTKTERALQIGNKIRYYSTTSDDPVIQELAAKDTATVFATDAIISLLMCASRSVYPWDLIINREGNKLFFDKRDGGGFDTISVNENAADPPAEKENKDDINNPADLALEATYVNHNFSFQVVKEDQQLALDHPNPFYGPEETDPLASCGYRYKTFDMSVNDEEDVKLCLRTEADAFLPNSQGGKNDLVSIKTLFEFDSRAQGAGGAPDWRTKLDSQRGAVMATEMKNNSFKLSRWAVQAVLAGAESMKIGFISRASPRDNTRHIILGSATMRPMDFAGQLNMSMANGWGIVRTITDLCMKQPDGKYILVRDPNKPVIRLYAVPENTLTGEDGEEEGEKIDENDEE
ncbi:translation initiation factor eIF-3 subunit D [Dacryopinax primogenitus]|uniref:Eukaryotic translation initiation factor 3 subunit D n=1 Tax=Dacryopinax primogenitus (strain DJM 731) TaxID=1858805 RepID=M5GCL8_DACPD|nr:translation initiation factor eIF-3 subunit D [Dacryopinax primogenitus]EJU06290.1 translation initiation factor eIF-3 subunit D [Dacryopinax primogenitus]